MFGNLICGGFGILMSQYGQVNKSCDILGCAKMVFWLHTARTESPDTPQTHPSASDFHEYHSNIPGHPPDIPQTPPRHLHWTGHANRQQQTPIDTTRYTQTAPLSVLGCLAVSVGVCWNVVFPGDIWGVPLGCLGVFWGIWVVIMEFWGAWMCLEGTWAPSPCSMEPKHHFSTAQNITTFVHLTILRHQNTKTAAYQLSKNDWVTPYF